MRAVRFRLRTAVIAAPLLLGACAVPVAAEPSASQPVRVTRQARPAHTPVTPAFTSSVAP